jgi:hypothetical protein
MNMRVAEWKMLMLSPVQTLPGLYNDTVQYRVYINRIK